MTFSAAAPLDLRKAPSSPSHPTPRRSRSHFLRSNTLHCVLTSLLPSRIFKSFLGGSTAGPSSSYPAGHSGYGATGRSHGYKRQHDGNGSTIALESGTNFSRKEFPADSATYSARISSPSYVGRSYSRRNRDGEDGDASSEEGILRPPVPLSPRVGITKTTDVFVVSQTS